MIKVGDIIDGRRITKVFELCGSIAYQSEVVSEPEPENNTVYFPEEPAKVEEVKEPEKPRRGRKKKEA